MLHGRYNRIYVYRDKYSDRQCANNVIVIVTEFKSSWLIGSMIMTTMMMAALMIIALSCDVNGDEW